MRARQNRALKWGARADRRKEGRFDDGNQRIANVVGEELSFQIQPTVEGAGYIRTADLALMTLEAKSEFPQGKGCRIRKLTDASMNDALAEIIGQATILPKEAVK